MDTGAPSARKLSPRHAPVCTLAKCEAQDTTNDANQACSSITLPAADFTTFMADCEAVLEIVCQLFQLSFRYQFSFAKNLALLTIELAINLAFAINLDLL